MQTLEIETLEMATGIKVVYDISGCVYVCQVCGHTVAQRPPEWCPGCKNHRILFKKTSLI